MKTGIIILAAGSSSRMGTSKLLLPINNKPMIAFIAGLAIEASANDVFIVLGHHAAEHQEALDGYNVHIVTNTRWHEGMGSSIKTGLQALLESMPDADAAIFLVGDQPYLTALHIERLIAHAINSDKPAVASSYSGTVGVPVLFKKVCFEQILQTREDSGAKKLIEGLGEQVIKVHFPEGQFDLDTPSDYTTFLNQAK